MVLIYLLFTLPLFLSACVSARDFSNPLKDFEGADPDINYVDGYYYLTYTTTRNIELIRATTLEGLKTGEKKVIFQDEDPSRNKDVWAPGKSNYSPLVTMLTSNQRIP